MPTNVLLLHLTVIYGHLMVSITKREGMITSSDMSIILLGRKIYEYIKYIKDCSHVPNQIQDFKRQVTGLVQSKGANSPVVLAPHTGISILIVLVIYGLCGVLALHDP